MHTHGSAGRRRGKPRSRILYWFRTPPGVRIGRSALDEDAIRLIEQHNPHIDFDWTQILRSQEGGGESREAVPQERRSRPRNQDTRYRGQTPVQAPATTPDTAVIESTDAQPAFGESSAPVVDTGTGVRPLDTADEAVQDVVAEFLVEPRLEAPVPRPLPGDALSAVESRLGSEGLSRLRARYSEVLARISETISDPARQEELKTTAERLNPDTWVTEADVRAGLEDYETVFESLRSVVGRRRRRSRRSSESHRTRGTQEPSGESAEPAEAGDEEDGSGSPDQQ